MQSFGVTHQSPQLILIKGKPFIMFRTVMIDAEELAKVYQKISLKY
jgi:hypothetical protein